MSYEIKNIIHSCHANIEFLKDIEQYIREQADTLSHEEKEYIKNSIINKKQMILELKTTIKEYENKENKAEYNEPQKSNQ